MTIQRNILIVDDDCALRTSLTEQLALHESCSVAQAADGKQALETIGAEQFHVILLDVGLPDADGRDICRILRRRGITTPILMLTAYDSDADTILGLDSGASDYIAKPFRMSVLMARLRAQFRQIDRSEDAAFTIGAYVFRPGDKSLSHPDAVRPLHLTEKEAAILKFLCRAGDRPVSRDTLLKHVWGYRPGITTHTLETHVYRIRQKIEPEPANARYLITEPEGYRLSR